MHITWFFIIFVQLKIINGEYEYHSKSVHLLPEPAIQKEINEFAEERAKTFYGGEPYEDNEAYYFHGGEVAVTVYEAREISHHEYEVLKNYLP